MRIFFVVADVGGLGRQWWMARQGSAFVDAVTSWTEAAGVWRHLVECRHQSAIDW
jgi:hypothetical protein